MFPGEKGEPAVARLVPGEKGDVGSVGLPGNPGERGDRGAKGNNWGHVPI